MSYYSDVKSWASQHGMIISKTGHGDEYRVTFRMHEFVARFGLHSGKSPEDLAYYTDDLADADCTMQVMWRDCRTL